MTTERAYRRPVAADAAVAELLTHAGAQFDPDAVAAFRAELADPSVERLAMARVADYDAPALSVSAG